MGNTSGVTTKTIEDLETELRSRFGSFAKSSSAHHAYSVNLTTSLKLSVVYVLADTKAKVLVYAGGETPIYSHDYNIVDFTPETIIHDAAVDYVDRPSTDFTYWSGESSWNFTNQGELHWDARRATGTKHSLPNIIYSKCTDGSVWKLKRTSKERYSAVYFGTKVPADFSVMDTSPKSRRSSVRSNSTSSVDKEICHVMPAVFQNAIVRILRLMLPRQINPERAKTVAAVCKSWCTARVPRDRVLGDGASGTVFIVGDKENEMVGKYYKQNLEWFMDGNVQADPRREMFVQSVVASLGLTVHPFLFMSCSGGKKQLLLSAKLPPGNTVAHFYDQLKTDNRMAHRVSELAIKSLRDLHDRRITHGDSHWGNMWLPTSDSAEARVWLLDFGRSIIHRSVETWCVGIAVDIVSSNLPFERMVENRPTPPGTTWKALILRISRTFKRGAPIGIIEDVPPAEDAGARRLCERYSTYCNQQVQNISSVAPHLLTLTHQDTTVVLTTPCGQ